MNTKDITARLNKVSKSDEVTEMVREIRNTVEFEDNQGHVLDPKSIVTYRNTGKASSVINFWHCRPTYQEEHEKVKEIATRYLGNRLKKVDPIMGYRIRFWNQEPKKI